MFAGCDARVVRSSLGSLFSMSFSSASASVLAQTAEECDGGSMGAGFVGGFTACASSAVTGAGLSLAMGSDKTRMIGVLIGVLTGVLTGALTEDAKGGSMRAGLVRSFTACASSALTGGGLSLAMGSEDNRVIGALAGAPTGEEHGSVGAESVGSFTTHPSTLTGPIPPIAMASWMVGVLAGELRGATVEPRISGDAAVTAVVLLAAGGRPCVFGAAGSECEVSGRGNAPVGTASD